MLRLAALYLSVLLCSGCALTTDTETIAYHSQPGASTVPGAGPVSVETADTRPGNHAQFSSKKNAFGMTMAPILSDQPAADVVQQAVIEELRHRGFRMAPGGPVVTVTMLQFGSDYDVGFFGADSNARVSFKVEVHNIAGAVLYANTVTGRGQEPMNQFMGGRNARIAIEAALADAMREMMNDPTLFRSLTQGSASAA